MNRKTKIVATIGPASQSEIMLQGLIRAGVDVARLNFSHGSHNDHASVIKKIRKLSHRLGKSVAILQDLQGPKIRTGKLGTDSISLTTGDLITLTTDRSSHDESKVFINYPDLPSMLTNGNKILLDDGKIELVVTSICGTEIHTKILLGGELGSHKGVNIPGVPLNLTGFTEKDLIDLQFGLEQQVDAIAISFVRCPEDVTYVRDLISHLKPELAHLPIIAKLERPEALENLSEIINEADGVMVARGDLGVEMPPETVPVAQKSIIQKANKNSKVVITATQMLESMIESPKPTRAEASDVANAIFDGTDAVMLSGETATGKFPLKAIEMMNAIICISEADLSSWGHWSGNVMPASRQDDTFYMALAARELAHDRNVAAIAVFTKSGRTALLMSKARPRVPILAFTPVPHTYRLASMYFGVYPYLVPHAETVEEMLFVIEKEMLASNLLSTGQQVVLICGYPVHEIRPTNMAIIHTIGDSS